MSTSSTETLTTSFLNIRLKDIPSGFLRPDKQIPNNTDSVYANTTISLLYKAYLNSLRMLGRRGYKEAEALFDKYIKQFNQVEKFIDLVKGQINPGDFQRSTFRRAISRLFTESNWTTDMSFRSDNPPMINHSILLFFLDDTEPEVKMSQFSNFAEYLLWQIAQLPQSEEPLRVILVHAFPMEKEVINAIANYNLNSSAIQISRFSYLELSYDPIEHFWVPPHQHMNEHQRRELLQKISPDKFPGISSEDPIVRYYGFPVGSLIAIRQDNIHYLAPTRYTWNFRRVAPYNLDGGYGDGQYVLKVLGKKKGNRDVGQTATTAIGEEKDEEDRLAEEYNRIIQEVVEVPVVPEPDFGLESDVLDGEGKGGREPGTEE